MEKWLVLGLGREIYKTSLEHVLPEGKEVFRKNKIFFLTNNKDKEGGMSKGYRRQLKELPVAKARTI